ncbi:MAG: Holliday junction resolvase RuvX [Anaerolineae bacterium]|nr:MAG: Holliday junction resolvase RuvX [Anaerolineae bacterium]
MRVLAVDYGEKNIGLAISDETGTLARPLGVMRHISKLADATQVATRAQAEGVGLIVVGISYDEQGQPNLSGRRAIRFVEALREQTNLPITLWDESLTTQDARAARLAAGIRRKRRAGHLDEWAATILLQDYLNSQETR